MISLQDYKLWDEENYASILMKIFDCLCCTTRTYFSVMLKDCFTNSAPISCA